MAGVIGSKLGLNSHVAYLNIASNQIQLFIASYVNGFKAYSNEAIVTGHLYSYPNMSFDKTIAI